MLKGSRYRNPAYSTAQKVERGYLKPLGAFVWQFNATDASKRFE